MAIKKRIFVTGLIITCAIFVILILANSILNQKREEAVFDRMNVMVNEYEDMQTLLLMSEFFGEDTACVSLKSMLSNMNTELWDLGRKIDNYRQVTEEFMKDQFYIEQKQKFNRREVLYFTMFKKMKDMCGANQTTVSFFYRKKELCVDCDAQSFVLSDIRHDLEKEGREDELALFSFDADMNLPAIGLLVDYYNFTSYPCIVVQDDVFCGLYNKQVLTKMLCQAGNMSICVDEK